VLPRHHLILEFFWALGGEPPWWDGTYPRPTDRRHDDMSEQEYGRVAAQVRTKRGKGAARQLRMKGLIPAVMYGGGGENLSLTIDPHLLNKAADPDKKYNTLFHLSIEREGAATEEVPCMIADVQRDAIRSDLVHVDFMRVDPEQEVSRKVPVRYFGRAAGVMVGGKLKTFQRTVRLAAKPAELPEELPVDVSPLESGAYLRIKDMSLPGSTFLEDPQLPLAYIEPAKAKTEEVEDDAAKKAAAKKK